jgi:hypothetical protein
VSVNKKHDRQLDDLEESPMTKVLIKDVTETVEELVIQDIVDATPVVCAGTKKQLGSEALSESPPLTSGSDVDKSSGDVDLGVTEGNLGGTVKSVGEESLEDSTSTQWTYSKGACVAVFHELEGKIQHNQDVESARRGLVDSIIRGDSEIRSRLEWTDVGYVYWKWHSWVSSSVWMMVW